MGGARLPESDSKTEVVKQPPGVSGGCPNCSAPASRTGCMSMTSVERSGLLTKPTGPQTTLHQGRPASSQVARKNCVHRL